MFSEEGVRMQPVIKDFWQDHIYPNIAGYKHQNHKLGRRSYHPIRDALNDAARTRGLWNLFLRI
jgi:hypothetical protein